MAETNVFEPKGVGRGERTQLNAITPARRRASSFGAAIAISQRELATLFFSPIAYVVGFAFLALTGYFFLTETLVQGNEASMRTLLERMAAVLVFTIPLLTMRTIADEFALGSMETLMTTPVSDLGVVLGKFMGTFAFYLILLAATLLHLVVLTVYSDPIMSSVVVGYVGMILMGALFIAIGIFASSLTRHQLLAAIIAIAVLGIFTFVVDYGAEYGRWATLRIVCSKLSILEQFSDFGKGIIDTRVVVYFLSVTAFFLFLANKVMESRRWR